MVNLKPKKIDKSGGMVFSKQPKKSSQHNPKLIKGFFVLCIWFLLGLHVGVFASFSNFSNTVSENIGLDPNLNSLSTNLMLWFDANNINGVDNAGLSVDDKITTWNDLSGNDYHATVYSGDEYKPTYEENFPSSNSVSTTKNPTVYFDGKDALIIGKEVDHSTFNMENMTIFIVGLNTDGNNQTYGGVYIAKGGESNAGWAVRTSSGPRKFNFTVRGTSGDDDTQGEVNVKNKDAVHVLSFDATNKVRKGWFNSSNTDFEQSESPDATISYSNAKLSLGAILKSDNHPYEGGRYLYGYVSEIIVFNDVLTDAQRMYIVHYLSKKWNLESVVDSDGDGFMDAWELANGTDPLDAQSPPPYVVPDFNEEVTAQMPNGQDPNFSNNVTSSLTLWLDASNIDVTKNMDLTNGDAVITWSDLSGNDYDAKVYNDDTGYAPNFNANVFPIGNGGNKPALYFDGQDGLFISNVAPFNMQEMTIFIVGYNQSSGAGAYVSKGGEGVGWAFKNRGNNANFAVRGVAGNADKSGSAIIKEANQVYVLNFSETAKEHNVWVNNAVGAPDINEDNTGNADINYSNTTPFGIGTIFSGTNIWTNRYLKGYVAEVLVFNDIINETDRISISHYLARKWGLMASVDSDGDGYVDASDNNPLVPDADQDGTPDDADAFPNDRALQSNPTITPNGLIKEIDRILGASANITIEGNTTTYPQLQTTENVKLWLDASQVHANFGNPAVDDEVRTWFDLSGNNHHGQVVDTGKDPQFVTDRGVGQSIHFHEYTSVGAETTGTAFRIPKFTNGLTKGEMYVVVRQDGAGNIDFRQGFHTWSVGRSIFVADTSNYLREGFGRNATTVTTDGSKFGMLRNFYGIYNVSVSENGKQIMRVQNIEKMSVDVTDIYWDEGTENFDMIGAASVLDQNDIRIKHQWRNGYIKEIIFFDTVLSDAERAAMHYYLANKWGTSDKDVLDSDNDGTLDVNDTTPFGSIVTDTDNDGVKDEWDYFPSDSNQYFWPSIVLTSSGPTFNTLDLAIQHITPNGIIYLADGNYGMTEGTTKNVEIKRKSGATNVSITLNARAN